MNISWVLLHYRDRPIPGNMKECMQLSYYTYDLTAVDLSRGNIQNIHLTKCRVKGNGTILVVLQCCSVAGEVLFREKMIR